MINKTSKWKLICCFVFILGPLSAADTLYLKEDGSWQNLGDDTDSRYIKAVADFKRQVVEGNISSARMALDELKSQYPRIAGKDLDLFMEAESLYGNGKWVDAVRKYDQMLDQYPDSWLFESAQEREFAIAVAFLNGQKRQVLKVLRLNGYEEAASIMHKIADRSGNGPLAQRALVTLARSYEKRLEYLDAYETWSEISSRWPTGRMGQTALLEMAQSLHSAYKSPSFDHTSLISARSYYNNFELRYPEDAEKYEIDSKKELIQEQLAYKQYSIGRYYEKTDSIEAALHYYNFVIDKFPGTTAAKMAEAKVDSQSGKIISDKSERKPARKAFDATTKFLDSWFGIEYLLKGSK